jgi:hypothetical protein
MAFSKRSVTAVLANTGLAPRDQTTFFDVLQRSSDDLPGDIHVRLAEITLAEWQEITDAPTDDDKRARMKKLIAKALGQET